MIRTTITIVLGENGKNESLVELGEGDPTVYGILLADAARTISKAMADAKVTLDGRELSEREILNKIRKVFKREFELHPNYPIKMSTMGRNPS